MFPCTSDTSQLEYTTEALRNLKGVNFAYINICSVTHKLHCIKILLEKSAIDFLLIGETFLNDAIDDSELAIPAYHFTEVIALLIQANVMVVAY